ncbi:AAA family ATPase [Bacillus mexicanus]|uniref:AAA family ATPase n=1 Tax=Bacillus mexicanus TaxID=2834415 RepID=UPI003D1F55B6
MGILNFGRSTTAPLFKVVRDANYYYEVKLRKSTISFVRTEKEAYELISKLEPKYNWKKIKDLNDLSRKDREFYESIRPLLRQYSVPERFNGNYLINKDEFGNVFYRLQKNNQTVCGKHLSDGLAIRENDDNNNLYHLDNVYKGETITIMNSEDQIIELYNKTKEFIPYHLEDINNYIVDEPLIKKFLEDAKISIVENKEIPNVNLEALSRFQFRIMGGTDPEKMKVYVESMKKLNNMIGLNAVKQKINIFIKNVYAERKLEEINLRINSSSLHSLFVGPPGTGKTEFARIIVELFWSLGMIAEKKIIELSKEDLVSSAIGGTEEVTKEKIQRSIGGILFVDEAYMLKGISGSQEDYGKIALEIIMRSMENHRDDLMVVFAGYQNEINELLNENPGLKSRFALTFNFEQYTPLELSLITQRMIENQGFVATKITDALKMLMSKKAKNAALQGNARDVRVFAEQIIRNHKNRIAENSEISLTVIDPEDVLSLINNTKIENKEGLYQIKLEAEKELNDLIGLNNIKEEIVSWSNYVTVERKRQEIGGSASPIRLHMTFEGNPGVGKTTVARIIGKILNGNGMLSKGHFVEVFGKDLVAGYMGQTSEKVKNIVNSALGGVLFIDEAYSMVKGKEDTFGREAVDRLIVEMENNVDDLVVILAGYTDEINELFQANPGFQSRIARRFLFEDYSSAELISILKSIINKNNFTLTDEAEAEVEKLIISRLNDDNINGNGRWVKSLFEKIKMSQANRLMNSVTEKPDFYNIEAIDVKKAETKI